MKLNNRVIFLFGMIVLAALVMIVPAKTQEQSEQNGLNGPNVPLDATEQGSFMKPGLDIVKSAAINKNGTVAACHHCDTTHTLHLGTGLYQVAFDSNVQAVNGYGRWVQADTLTIGTENAWCNTADRFLDEDAIWVNCQTTGGPGSMGESKPVDVSFFLFVTH